MRSYTPPGVENRMGVTTSCSGYVGFVVRESDFWDIVPAQVATCEKAHPQPGDEPFCSKDGTPFVRRNGREASQKFQKLAAHLGWKSDDTGLRSWLEGYERMFANLQEEDSESIGLYMVNRHTPVHEGGSPVLAIARRVGHIPGWARGTSPLLMAVSGEDLTSTFQELVRARDVAGFDGPVRLFLTLYVS
jgi:hypothetical protein